MNLTETVKRQNEMRSDYSLYIVALICFIIAGALLAVGLEQTLRVVSASIFVILGILFAAAGYALRPRVVAKAPEAPPLPVTEPSPPPTPPPPPPAEEEIPSAPPSPPTPPPEEEIPTPPTLPPAPPPTLEEPAKVEEEKPEEKPVRKRRRKKAT